MNTAMTNPAKNRLHDYEAGWLTLLVEMGVATKKAALTRCAGLFKRLSMSAGRGVGGSGQRGSGGENGTDRPSGQRFFKPKTALTSKGGLKPA